MLFQLDRSSGIEVGVVIMSPRLDADNCRELQRLFPQWLEMTGRIVFDCSALDFLDSSGLGAIVTCLRKVISRGGDLRITSMRPRVAMIFELTRAITLFSVFPDLDGAIRSFGPDRSVSPT
jgi:anti-sigma B factor antagonist